MKAFAKKILCLFALLLPLFLAASLLLGRVLVRAEDETPADGAPVQYHYGRKDGEEEILYSFFIEDGVEGWNFNFEDITSTIKQFDLDGNFEARRAYEISVIPFVEGTGTPAVTVRIRLDRELLNDRLTLFRYDETGPKEVEASVEDGFLVFTETDFLETDYVVATESNFPLYLALSLVFGTACIAGAVTFVVYLKKRSQTKSKE